MKLKFTIFSSFMFLCMILLMSHSGGRATQFGEGNTGAPGDNGKVCSTCHTGGNFGTSIDISLTDLDGNSVTNYIGEQTYIVTATINTTSTPVGYGLQMVGLINNDDSNAGILETPSENAQLAELNDRTYIEQAGLSSSNTFTAEWTAPLAGSGDITFYASGHAANGNGNSGGDEASIISVTFSENFVESTVNFNRNLFSISPNPVVDFTTVSLEENIDGNLMIYSGSGQVMYSSPVNGSEFVINLSDFATGSYLISIQNQKTGEISTKQIIKM